MFLRHIWRTNITANIRTVRLLFSLCFLFSSCSLFSTFFCLSTFLILCRPNSLMHFSASKRLTRMIYLQERVTYFTKRIQSKAYQISNFRNLCSLRKFYPLCSSYFCWLKYTFLSKTFSQTLLLRCSLMFSACLASSDLLRGDPYRIHSASRIWMFRYKKNVSTIAFSIAY